MARFWTVSLILIFCLHWGQAGPVVVPSRGKFGTSELQGTPYAIGNRSLRDTHLIFGGTKKVLEDIQNHRNAFKNSLHPPLPTD